MQDFESLFICEDVEIEEAAVFNAINGRPVEGWSSLIVMVLLLGGLQMAMMSVLGEYLWHTLDEARRHPRYIVEVVTQGGSGKNQAAP